MTSKGWSYSTEDFNDASEFRTPLKDGWEKQFFDL